MLKELREDQVQLEQNKLGGRGYKFCLRDKPKPAQARPLTPG